MECFLIFSKKKKGKEKKMRKKRLDLLLYQVCLLISHFLQLQGTAVNHAPSDIKEVEGGLGVI